MTGVRRDAHRRFLYREAEELQRDLRELGLDIPWSDDLSPLLSPISIGNRTLPNRLAIHPMEGFDSTPDGSPGELSFRRYRRFASGGSSLIWFEATSVVEEGRSNPRQLFLHEGNVSAFRSLVARTREAVREGRGQGSDPVLVLQLTHSGRWSKPRGSRMPVIARHMEMLDRMVGLDEAHPVISDDELDRLQDTFVDAARLAAGAGFDGVDVKACHGYLTSELLGAFKRIGRYGGSFENRTRFLREVVDRIRIEVPDLLVTTRLNAFDGLPFPHGFGAGPHDESLADRAPEPDLAEPIRLLQTLRDLGTPLANITLGIPYLKPHFGRPFNRAVPGSPSAPEHPLVGVARFQDLTGRLQKALPDLPLVGTGYSWLRQFFPNVGAAALRDGQVSLVGVGRMAFAYPDFARDLMERGAMDPRKTCVGCSGCSELMRDGRHSGCVVRDGDLYQLPRVPRKGEGRGEGKGARG